MLRQLILVVNPVQLIVFITLLVVLFFSDRHKTTHRVLLYIVAVSATNEVITTICILKGWHYGLIYALASALHNILWLFLLQHLFGRTRESGVLLTAYAILCAISITMVARGYNAGNSCIFITGGFLYLYALARNTFARLYREDLSLLHSNQALLLYAPVVFFLGFSIVLGFQSNALADTPIAGRYNLYDIVACFVNIIYYALMNIYLFREKKLSHA